MSVRELPQIEVVISTTTGTAHEAALRAYPGKLVFFYPLDFSFATHRVLRRVRPTLVLLMELELWPNFLLTTSINSVPVLLANGRMSPKSERDYVVQTDPDTFLLPEGGDLRFHWVVARTDRLVECERACIRALSLTDDPEVETLLARTRAAGPRELNGGRPARGVLAEQTAA